MTKYNVHIYREIRLQFDGIEADSPEHAAEKARDMHFDEAGDWSDCEGETLAALVDVAGDEDYTNSKMIDFEPGRMLKAAPKLLEALANLTYQNELMDKGVNVNITTWDNCMATARAAIAKATGQGEAAEAGSVQEKRRADIIAVWDKCPAEEGYAIFSLEGYDNTVVAEALGQHVASEYAHWISANIRETAGEERGV